MDKNAIRKKNIAFTLAEMLVILTVFSVIAASTLPIMTAPQKLGNSSNSVTGEAGEVQEVWTLNTNNGGMVHSSNTGLFYSPDSSFTDSTISVGMGPSLSVESAIQPRMVVNKQHANGSVLNASHINFSAMASPTLGLDLTARPYPAGRISMIGRNIAIGYMALWNSGTALEPIGNNNIAIGANTMNRYTEMANENSANENSIYYTKSSIAIGHNTFYGGRGSYNIAIGPNAGTRVIAARSMYIGEHAGVSWNVASNVSLDSIFIGTEAGYLPNVGSQLNINSGAIAIGYRAGLNTLFQQKSIFLGYYAGSGLGNYCSNSLVPCGVIAIGSYAGSYITHAPNTMHSHNIFIGKGAGYASNVAASSLGNIFIGTYAGKDASFQDFLSGLVAIGSYALYNSKSSNIGSYGVVIGTYAGANLRGTSPYSNGAPVLIGNFAHGTDFGSSASVAIGDQVGRGLADATGSVLIGTWAGNKGTDFNTTYRLNNSICIGDYTCTDDKNLFDVIRIGHLNNRQTVFSTGAYSSHIGNVFPSTSATYTWWKTANPVMLISTHKPPTETGAIFDFSSTSILLYAGNIFTRQGTFTTFSDKRLKENIKLSKYSLKDLRRINVYEYNFKDDGTKAPKIGVLAQELKEIIPQAVTINPYNGFLSVNSSWIIYTMVNSVKELDKKIQQIQTNLNLYAKEFVNLSVRVEQLEKETRALERENRKLVSQVNAEYKKVKLSGK